jgi:hypothetical protein
LLGDLCPKLDKCDAQIGRAADGCRFQNLTWPAAQIFQLLAHELAAILLLESKPDFDLPAASTKNVRSNQRIACVMTFPGEHDALSGVCEKLCDGLRDTGACLIHERFNLHPHCESGLFRGSHLRRGQNRQIQISPPGLLSSTSLLLNGTVSMSFSFSARFFCVNVWTYRV